MITMKIGIVGSRDYPTEQHIRSFISLIPKDWTIVTGGQKKGVDRWVRKHGSVAHDVVEFPPEHYRKTRWALDKCPLTGEDIEYGKDYAVSHYHVRNRRISSYSDIVVGFTRMKQSPGTMSTLSAATAMGKTVHRFIDIAFSKSRASELVEHWRKGLADQSV